MLVHVPWFTQESSHRTWCINVTVTDKLFVLMTLWVLKLCGKVQYLRLWTAACSVQSWESDRVQCCHDIRETPLSCITSTTSTHLSASQCSISHKSHSIVPTRSLCVIYFIRVCVCIYIWCTKLSLCQENNCATFASQQYSISTGNDKHTVLFVIFHCNNSHNALLTYCIIHVEQKCQLSACVTVGLSQSYTHWPLIHSWSHRPPHFH